MGGYEREVKLVEGRDERLVSRWERRTAHARHVAPPPRAAAVAGCFNVNYMRLLYAYAVFAEASRDAMLHTYYIDTVSRCVCIGDVVTRTEMCVRFLSVVTIVRST